MPWMYCQLSQKGPIQYLPFIGADLEQSSTQLCYPSHLIYTESPFLGQKRDNPLGNLVKTKIVSVTST